LHKEDETNHHSPYYSISPSFFFFSIFLLLKMINRPNNVVANQRYFQTPSQTPLWIKGKRDKFIVSIVFAGLAVGVVGSLHGAVK
jgi:hypothetical protein